MIKVDIIAVGKLRDESLQNLWAEYSKRINYKLTVFEIEARKPQDIDNKINDKINSDSYVIVLDERGKSLTSIELANKIKNQTLNGINHMQFIIGGADGLSKNVINKADLLLSFGSLTWPHKMIRIMLCEQLYRAQQIIAGHPYHRE